ncbi:hypothetical protein MINTM005_17050 [Mycobacterium intracellulare]|nr:hypothetical protein MINTM005_17050 [Mycobacterium intracellulare]BCO93602.1 hypothetical protein MINTM016_15780 [Mycobacterium intracellulare]
MGCVMQHYSLPAVSRGEWLQKTTAVSIGDEMAPAAALFHVSVNRAHRAGRMDLIETLEAWDVLPDAGIHSSSP